ncbi:PREDICTED: sugar transporter SWEET1-like [Papilio polytes]|uniref:sugar transporter SWEET1-like n=1 Tax=Papilio polytes TaxID=76194 RepID=UPI0006762912|nr:PREDICTED: sugar transporter SWEET1-like [Papilio polytes]
MEALSDVMQPYKELVGSVAAIVTIGQMFSGSFICYDVYKQGSTRGITIAPFLGGVVMSLLNKAVGTSIRTLLLSLSCLKRMIKMAVIYFVFQREIIRNKSTEGLPFPIIFSGAIVTFMWLLYGIILKNKFLVIQNVVAVILCSIQLALFVIYPSKPAAKEKVKAKAKKAD